MDASLRLPLSPLLNSVWRQLWPDKVDIGVAAGDPCDPPLVRSLLGTGRSWPASDTSVRDGVGTARAVAVLLPEVLTGVDRCQFRTQSAISPCPDVSKVEAEAEVGFGIP